MSKGTCRRLMDADARKVLTSLCKGLLVFSLVALGRAQTQSAPFKAGSVVSKEPTGFTLQTDSGQRLAVALADHALFLRVPPNSKDLKNATKITAADISVGDRVVVRGRVSDDQKTLLATVVMDMSKADVAKKQAAESADWQRRGVGGLVSSVDPVASTIEITTMGFAGTKKTLIHVSKDTLLRRYSPDSAKFEDAQPGTFDQIRPGDQLRARGTRSAEGNDFAAEEIVSGSFRNIAGTVSSIDVDQNTLSVMDLKTKKPVLVKFSPDSQLRKLDPMMAQGIAMRLKGGAAGGPANASGGSGGTFTGRPPAGGPPASGGAGGAGGGAGGPGGGPGGPRQGGAPDFQRLLSRMPQATLADLKKGDAVMIVATQGTDSGGVTAITLLSGVEPILTASPSASQAMFMAGWNLGGAPGGAGGEEGTQ